MKAYALALGALLLLAGCGEKKDDEKKAEAPVAASGGIEVSKNTKAFEHKVAEKGVDKNQSKSYYYDYNTEKKKTAAEPEEQRTSIDANLHVRSPYEQIEIELLVHKLSKDFIVRCSACHNDYANGIIGPSLLDKDSEFIYNSINDFKTGKQENVLMTALVKQMSDEQIQKLANEIAEFNIEIKNLRSRRGNQ